MSVQKCATKDSESPWAANLVEVYASKENGSSYVLGEVSMHWTGGNPTTGTGSRGADNLSLAQCQRSNWDTAARFFPTEASSRSPATCPAPAGVPDMDTDDVVENRWC